MKLGTIGIVDASRAAGDDYAFSANQLRGRRFAGQDVRIDAQIAHLSREQVAVLPSCVEDRYLRRQTLRRRCLVSGTPVRSGDLRAQPASSWRYRARPSLSASNPR